MSVGKPEGTFPGREPQLSGGTGALRHHPSRLDWRVGV